MKIADSIAFIEHKKVLNIGLNDKGSKTFLIALNFSTGLYIKILSLVDLLSKTDNNIEQLTNIVEIVTDILKTADKKINQEWVSSNIDIQTQIEIVTEILTAINKILEKDCLSIPNITVIKKTELAKGEDAKQRQKTKENIARYNELLAEKADKNLMDEIAIVMIKTSNTYSEVMNMPILIFKDLIRTITLNELRTDDDYNLAYLKYLADKTEIELNSGQANKKPTAKRKGGNLQAIKAFAGM